MLHGSATIDSSNTSTMFPPFSASFTQFDMLDTSSNPNTSRSLSGKAVGIFMDVTLDDSSALSLTGSSAYNYPASLSLIAGTYSGTTAAGQVLYNLNGITVSGSTLTLPANADGCSASGTLTPHQTPHGTVNVFDTSITFSGTGCTLGSGTTVQGITIATKDQPNNPSDPVLLDVMTVTPDGQNGFMVLATHQ
jgi:hypothetical protein